MKIKRKGKVHPSSSSSSSSSSLYKDAISVLKLLPATILALAAALSVEDREVVAYMITRSITTANPSSITDLHKKKCKTHHHKLPLFQCACFDCYTSFWFRWDSSLDRDLIHRAIEAFEDHLTLTLPAPHFSSTEPRKTDNLLAPRRRSRRRRHTATTPLNAVDHDIPTQPSPVPRPETGEHSGDAHLACAGAETTGDSEVEMDMLAVSAPATHHHKGLARKVLPDVVGLLNSRLWSLWGPNN